MGMNIESIFAQLKAEVIFSSGAVNRYAEKRDHLRNGVNYGYASHSADMLRRLDVPVKIDIWSDDEGFLRVNKLIMYGVDTTF
jgi:hypothetical protein